MLRARISGRCCAHNAFDPTPALWQYFVAARTPRWTPHPRWSSTEAAAPPVETSNSIPSPIATSIERPPSDPALGNPFENDGPSAEERKAAEVAAWIQRKKKLSRLAKERALRDEYAARRQRLMQIKGERRLAEKNRAGCDASRQLRNLERLHMAQEAVKRGEDYEGQIMALSTVSPKAVEKLHAPWELRYRVASQIGRMEQLQAAISKFNQYTRPNTHEAAARDEVARRVIQTCRDNSPGFAFEVFGSQLTKLARPLSDIDILIYHPAHKTPWPTALERRALMEQLRIVQSRLRRDCRFSNISLLHSRYPLVSVLDNDTGLQVQIVSASAAGVGHSRDAVYKYLKEYPFLWELFPVVKTFFISRGLSEVYIGGFGSYTIFMMIVAALKFSDPAKNAAEGLINFFTFWSHDPTIDTSPFYRKGISIDPPELFDKYAEPVGPASLVKEIKAGQKPHLPDYMLCLRDPADPTNDLGHKAASIKHLRVTCAIILKNLYSEERANNERLDQFLTRKILGVVHEDEKPRRAKLYEYGRALNQESGADFRKLLATWNRQSPLPVRRVTTTV